MQDHLPLQFSHPFKCQIISSFLSKVIQNRSFYHCSTNFGKMTLIVEEILSETLQFNHRKLQRAQKNTLQINDLNGQQFLQKRNDFLSQYPFCTFIPVIYEQYIITSHKHKSICLTLIEPVEVFNLEELQNKVSLQLERNLVLSLFFMEYNNLNFFIDLSKQSLINLTFLRSQITDRLNIDFTQLELRQYQKMQNQNHQQTISNFINILCNQQSQHAMDFDQFNEIILIKDHVYRFQRSKFLLRKFKSWFEVTVCFNFLLDHEVFIKVKEKNPHQKTFQKTRKTALKHLSSNNANIPIEFYHTQTLQISGAFHFYDGYCIDLLQPIDYDKLLKSFFADNSTYVLKKGIYLEVERIKTDVVKTIQQKGDVIYIEDGVAKSQCINFFISYCKFVDPTLKKVSFEKQRNSLIFQFLGKFKVERKLCLIFHKEYIIKDEQLSMIIQKSKLQGVSIELSQMQITDSFLMFLANSQKMSKVKELNISYCKRVTENGVNSLLISPYCKNLEILKVSGTPVIQSSIESLLTKTQIKQLFMNHCIKSQDDSEELFVLQNVKLLRLQALGMNIQPVFSSNIEFLKIDTPMSLDFLKELKDMPLKELKIKLIQAKKNIIGGFLGTIGNFYTKEVSPVKIFAQSRSNKSLKSIDLSGSSAKIKNLKSIFLMSQLEVLKIEDITVSQQIQFSISSKILDLSIRNSWMSVKQLSTFIKHTKVMMKLNIADSYVKKEEIKEFLCHSKKYINTLVISQSQYQPGLIDSNGKASEFVETFELLCKQNFFRHKNENLISSMILKTLKGNKTLRLLPQQNIESFQIHSFSEKNKLAFEAAVLKSLAKIITPNLIESSKNLFIIDQPYKNAAGKNEFMTNQEEGINCEQFLRVYKRGKKTQMYKLFPSQNCNKNHSRFNLCHKIVDEGVPNDQLSYLTLIYKKCVLQNPDGTIEVSLRNNQVIDCQSALKMMIEYHPHRQIKSIDMRGATLTNPSLLLLITEIPHLQAFNHNQYQLQFEQNDFVNLSQKYLKFFMKITSLRKLKLKCLHIIESDILFSILFHILDSHYETVEELDVSFESIRMNTQNSFSFWSKISQLKKLTVLKLKFQNCVTHFLKKIFDEHEFNLHKKLETLVLEGLHFECLPIVRNEGSIKNITINLQNSQVNQAHVVKFLKNFGNSLRRLHLNLSQCDNIQNPNRLFTIMGNFTNLEKLTVSFQHCPIKELSTLDFLENIYSLKQLKQLQIDLSFTLLPFSSISNIVNNFPIRLPNSHILIYLIGNEHKEVIFDKEGLLNQGVEVVL